MLAAQSESEWRGLLFSYGLLWLCGLRGGPGARSETEIIKRVELNIFLFRAESDASLHTCSPCHSVECETLHQCQAGVVPDRCGCCQVCARREGELCDDRGDHNFGTCGDNLDCQYQQETEESICVCR